MIPLVDMMNCGSLHDIDGAHAMSYVSYTLPCDALLDINVAHVELHSHDENAIAMPCSNNFEISPIVACNMKNNCSFPCIACNEVEKDAYYVVTNLKNNCSFPMFVDNNDKTLNMFCTRCLQYSHINASKMLNNYSFQCLV